MLLSVFFFPSTGENPLKAAGTHLRRQWVLYAILTLVFVKLISWLYAPYVDFQLFYSWTERAKNLPLSEFYSGNYEGTPRDWAYREENTDRLPTDVWLFQFWGWLFAALPGSDSEIVKALIRFTAWLAEVAFAVSLWWTMEQFRPKNRSNLKWVLLFLALPTTLIISNLLYTFELIPATFTVLALGLVYRGSYWNYGVSGFLLAAAVLERPQFALVALAVIAYGAILHRSLGKILLLLGAGVASALALTIPLGLGLFWDGGNGSILDLLFYNLVFYDTYSWSAATLWSWMPNSTTALYSDFNLLGISALGWCYILSAVTIIAGVSYARRKLLTPFAIFWLFGLGSQALFFFAPRMLERYNFVAVLCLFIALLIYYSRRLLIVLAAMTVVSALNSLVAVWIVLVVNYGILSEAEAFGIREIAYGALAVGNLLVIAGLFWVMAAYRKAPVIHKP